MSGAKKKETKLAAVKKQLLERKRELEEQLAELYIEKVSDQVQDLGDQAQSITMETLKISIQDAEINEYNRILKALKMIDEGTYGICDECGQPISEKRLTLYPNAMRCLVCQEQLEESKKSS